MSFIVLTKSPTPADCASFITVYKPIAGWKAVQYWWNPDPDLGGFWEPWQTGICAFNTEQSAIDDALFWAEMEDLPFYYASYRQKAPEHMSESPDYDPAQKPSIT
jgi:hypothetical protein